MKRASIDIGSNSVLLLLVEIDSQTGVISEEILNVAHVTSLGKEIDKNQVFLEERMQATFDVLKEYKALLDREEFPIEEVLVTATEASRVAKNASEFYAKVKSELGFDVKIISADKEAYLTGLGVSSSNKTNQNTHVTVMDIGGASTELIKINLNPFNMVSSVSLPIGSVRAMELIAKGQFEEKIKELLTAKLNSYKTEELICVAGTMTSLGAIYKGLNHFDASIIDGMNISMVIFPQFVHDLNLTTIENLNLLFPYLEKRTPMLGAGGRVALEIAKHLSVRSLIISTRGLRYGSVIEGKI